MKKAKTNGANASGNGAKAKKKTSTKRPARKAGKSATTPEDAETGNVPTIPADNFYRDETRVVASQDNPILQPGPGGLASAMREIIRRDQEQADETRKVLEDFFFGDEEDDEDDKWWDEDDFEDEE